MNYEEDTPKYREFKQELLDTSQDWLNIYIMAVNEGMDYHAYLILQSGNINLKNNNDNDMLFEIIDCINSRRDDVIGVYISDGYIPSENHLKEIMDIYSTLDVGNYDLTCFSYFNQLFRNLKIKQIKTALNVNQPQL